MSSVNCPNCKNDENVQKVSVIYSSGTRTDLVQTDLARKLSPPTPGCLWYAVWIFPLFGMIASWFAPIKTKVKIINTVLLGLLFIVAVIACQFFYALPAFLSEDGMFAGMWITIICGGLVVSAVGLTPIFISFRALGNTAKEWRKKWDELYYCYKDDIVFYPSTGQFASSENMKELIRTSTILN